MRRRAHRRPSPKSARSAPAAVVCPFRAHSARARVATLQLRCQAALGDKWLVRQPHAWFGLERRPPTRPATGSVCKRCRDNPLPTAPVSGPSGWRAWQRGCPCVARTLKGSRIGDADVENGRTDSAAAPRAEAPPQATCDRLRPRANVPAGEAGVELIIGLGLAAWAVLLLWLYR